MPGNIQGTVVAITDAGNLVTDIGSERLESAPRDESVTVHCNGHQTHGIFEADHKEPPSTLIAVLGDDGKLQIEIVGDSASIMLGVRAGAEVKVQW